MKGRTLLPESNTWHREQFSQGAIYQPAQNFHGPFPHNSQINNFMCHHPQHVEPGRPITVGMPRKPLRILPTQRYSMSQWVPSAGTPPSTIVPPEQASVEIPPNRFDILVMQLKELAQVPPDKNLWIETEMPQERQAPYPPFYFFNALTRETCIDRPTGNVVVMKRKALEIIVKNFRKREADETSLKKDTEEKPSQALKTISQFQVNTEDSHMFPIEEKPYKEEIADCSIQGSRPFNTSAANGAEQYPEVGMSSGSASPPVGLNESIEFTENVDFVEKKSVAGTPWFVQISADKKISYYNGETCTQFWERPPELKDNSEVDLMISDYCVPVKPLMTALCGECGFTGPLPCQCRDFFQLCGKSPSHNYQINGSPIRSESQHETPLKCAKKERKRIRKEVKELKKIKKQIKKKAREEEHRSRRSTSSSSSDSDGRHKHKKKSKKHSRKKYKRRSYSPETSH